MAPSALPLAEPQASVRNRLLALTGLRILPALAVYGSHLRPPRGSPDWLARALATGYYGVTIFFVLSGFVLAINYFDAFVHPTARALWGYAVARFARIYPLYLLVLAYLLCRARVLAHVNIPSWPWHVAGLQAWLPSVFDAYAFGPAWSISVEVFLYATLPLLVLALARLRGVRQHVAAALVTIAAMTALAWWFQHTGRAALPTTDPSSAHRWLYRTPLTRLGDFVLGILAARLYVLLRGRALAGWLGRGLIAAGLVAIALLSSQPWITATAFTWDVGYAVPGVALILGLALAPRNAVARVLATPALVLLGEASYAFYLIHATVAIPLGAGSWALDVTPTTLTLEAMALGLTLALAIGLHIGLERPARVLIRRTLVRPQREASRAAATAA